MITAQCVVVFFFIVSVLRVGMPYHQMFHLYPKVIKQLSGFLHVEFLFSDKSQDFPKA